MSAKKDTKIHNKKHLNSTVPVNQRSPNSKQSNKSTVVSNHDAIDVNPLNKIDGNGQLTATNKSSPTKTSRNQVSANWNSVAGTLKPQRTIPSNKKIGKQIHYMI